MISTIANKVSPFDHFKTKSLQTFWDLRTTNIVSMNLTNILTSLNPQKQLLKEVEDGVGANIFPRHPIIHEKDEGGSKPHIIENNAIPT